MSSSAAETSHQKYCYYDYLMRINGFSDGEVKQKLSDDEYQYYQTFLNQKQEMEQKEKQSNSSQSKSMEKKKYRSLFQLFRKTFVLKKDATLSKSLLEWRDTIGRKRGIKDSKPVISTLYKWAKLKYKGRMKRQINKYPKRRSPKKVLTFDTLHCIFIVAIHFPFSSNAKKAAYIRKQGPPEAKKISESTVALGMHKLKFCHKKAKPS